MRATLAAVLLWVGATLEPAAASGAHKDALAMAAERVRAGDAADALSLLEALTPEEAGQADARYLRARLLERLGRPHEALAALPRDRKALPPSVALDVRLRRAALLADTGACVAARPIFEALVAEGHHVARARMGAGSCALTLGDHAAAIEALRGIGERAAGIDHFTRRLRLAAALRGAGQPEAATRELWSLWLERPDHADIDQVRSALLELGGRAPDELTLEERLARAQRWRQVRLPERAVAELDAAPRPRARSDEAEWRHARGMALFKTRTRYADAARELQRAARLGSKTEAADAFFAARALSRADRDRQAIRAYRAFARRYPRSRRVAEALYLAAWLELRHGQAAGARHMRRFLRDHAKGSRGKGADATFQLAMGAFEARRHARAGALFERYADTNDAAMVRGRGLYWAGRAAERAGRRAHAAEVFRRAMAVAPLHWYGLLACSRLKVLGHACGDPFGPEAPGSAQAYTPLSLRSLPLPADARFYARLGLVADATRSLEDAEAAVRDTAPTGRAAEALVAAYREIGADGRAHRVAVTGARALLARRPALDNAWAWDAAYARPHHELVTTLADAEALPEALVYAIMRKESAFDPSVVSHADAVGLMQLLPTTAARVAADLGIPFERGELFDPAENLRLATHLLHELMQRFDGQAPLAIAAYNAGAHRVEPWLRAAKKHKRLELDLFVEHIPVEQTRNYVRRVMGNWARYRYLADPLAGWSPELPERVRPP